METKEKPEEVKAIVADKLAKHPTLRDDDRKLILSVYSHFGFRLTPQQRSLFLKMPNIQTIVRARRNMRDLYPASPDVEAARERHGKRLATIGMTIEPTELPKRSLLGRLRRRGKNS